MSDLNDLNRPVTTDTEPNVLDTLRAHIIRAATWSGWSGTANKVAGLMSGVTAAVAGGRSMRLYRRNDTNTADEEVVSLPSVSIGGLAAGLSNKADYMVRLPAISSTEIDSAIESGFREVGYVTYTTTLLCWNAGGSTGTVQVEVGSSGDMRSRNRRDGTEWMAWRISVTNSNIAALVDGLNAATATKLSTTRLNWVAGGVAASVVGQLAWRNYGDQHTIFDASSGTNLDGGAVNNTDPATPWAPGLPVLMGSNGGQTYGVRVDSARVADKIKGDVGMVAHFARSTAPAGWLKANGGTIGSAASGATLRANADALDLFTMLWGEFSNTILEIQTSAGAATSRGSSASADFAANKRLPVPDMRGEFLRGWADDRAVDTGRTLGSAQGGTVESHSHKTDGTDGGDKTPVWAKGVDAGFDWNSGVSTGQDADYIVGSKTGTFGSAETRPRNIALLACIRY